MEILISKSEAEHLVFLNFFSIGVAKGVRTDFLVILLKSSQILTSFREFTFLHTFTNIPVDESTLGVHKIELVVKARPGLGNGSGVGQHADGTLNLGNLTAGDDAGSLVVDADLETGGAPVDELDGTLGLDLGNGGSDILGDDISTVQETTGHVLSVPGVALDHLVRGLETGSGDLLDAQLLVEGLLGRQDRGIGDQGEVDAGVRDQVGLEFGQIDVQRSNKAERSGDRGDNLGNHAVQVSVRGAGNIQVATANVVNSLVVDHERTVSVLQGGVGGQDRVVGLNNGSRHLGCGVHGKLELGLLAVVGREALEKKGTEAGTGTTTEGVEDEESLETGTSVRELADAVEDVVDELLADGVVSTGIVVSGILLSADELLGVEEAKGWMAELG